MSHRAHVLGARSVDSGRARRVKSERDGTDEGISVASLVRSAEFCSSIESSRDTLRIRSPDSWKQDATHVVRKEVE